MVAAACERQTRQAALTRVSLEAPEFTLSGTVTPTRNSGRNRDPPSRNRRWGRPTLDRVPKGPATAIETSQCHLALARPSTSTAPMRFCTSRCEQLCGELPGIHPSSSRIAACQLPHALNALFQPLTDWSAWLIDRLLRKLASYTTCLASNHARSVSPSPPGTHSRHALLPFLPYISCDRSALLYGSPALASHYHKRYQAVPSATTISNSIMLLVRDSIDSRAPYIPMACYFSMIHQPHAAPHFSDETPMSSPIRGPRTPSDPCNPLLALRSSPPASTAPPRMDASKLLQLQTAAAYSLIRPKPQPLQDILEVSHDSFYSSASSSPSSSPSSSDTSIRTITPPPQIVRCSRCQRSASIDSGLKKSGMVSFGTNLYYCNRCASFVGYGG